MLPGGFHMCAVSCTNYQLELRVSQYFTPEAQPSIGKTPNMVSLNLIGRQEFMLQVTGTFDLMTPKYGA